MAHTTSCFASVFPVRYTAMLLAPVLVLMLACSADSTTAPAAVREGAVANATANYSFSITPADRTIHVRFARMRSNENESIGAFMQRVFDSADAAGATRLVLDLSAARGGDAFLAAPLVRGVLARENFLTRGGLIVIVGPDSFSPSQSTARLLQKYAQPIFAKHPVS